MVICLSTFGFLSASGLSAGFAVWAPAAGLWASGCAVSSGGGSPMEPVTVWSTTGVASATDRVRAGAAPVSAIVATGA